MSSNITRSRSFYGQKISCLIKREKGRCREYMLSAFVIVPNINSSISTESGSGSIATHQTHRIT